MSNDTLDDSVEGTFAPELIGTTAPSGPMLPYRLELDVRIQIGLYSAIFFLVSL